MTEKLKRKNNEPIPRRYWWIFGTLAILLLISLRFPVRILTHWEWNIVLYGCLALACLIVMGYIRVRYDWRQPIVKLILLCALLSCWQSLVSFQQGGLNNDFCTVEYGLITHYRCSYIGNCPTLLRDYATLGNLPIGIELLDYYDNPCGYPRSQIEQM